MIYTPMTRKALLLAWNAHMGQTDPSGLPYIFHPYHLAETMDDEISCTVALLHDVVEDTTVTMEELRAQFPPRVIQALELLTHRPGQDYFEYVRAIRADPLAMRVKLADLDHNSDFTRSEGLVPEARLEHWRRKYQTARRILLEESEG